MSVGESSGASDPPLERPIIKGEQDKLDRRAFVTRLGDTLIAHDGKRARGVVVGLVGPWGSGKSSVLNLLSEELDGRSPKPVVVRFDPWLISGRDDLIVSLLAEMHAAIVAKNDFADGAKRFLDAAAPYLEMLGRAGDAMLFSGTGKVVQRGVDAARTRLGAPTGLLKLKESVASALNAVPGPVIILIDEIDRLQDDEIRTIAQLVRAVADFPHVSYLLAYDQQRVEEALGGDGVGAAADRRERGRRYLEKLVHMPVPLPALATVEMAELLDAHVQGICVENGLSLELLETKRARQLRTLLVQGILTTPRDIHRVAGTFRVMLGMVREDVDALDVLGFAALHTKFPDLCEIVRRRPGEFVYFPDDQRAAMRSVSEHGKDQAYKLKARFGSDDIAREARNLLAFLWPDLGDGGQTSGHEVENPVRDWRPLQVILRLGLPPGLVSRAEAGTLLNASRDTARQILDRALTEGKLSDLMERASLAYPFHEHAAPEFLLGLAAWMNRSVSDWTPEPSPKRSVIENAKFMILQRVERGPEDRASLSAVLTELVEQQRDTHLAPFLLQSLSIHYGMFGRQASKDLAKTQLVSKHGTERLFHVQASWAPEAFRNGELFFELHHGGLLHQLADIGAWDARCRQHLLELIATPQGIDQFALLFFSGGYTTEIRSLEKLLDVQHAISRAGGRLQELTSSGSDQPYVRKALEKFVEQWR